MRGRKPEAVQRKLLRGEIVDESPFERLDGRPPMPAGLSDRQKTAWRQIVDLLAATKALSRADAILIEAMAVAVGRAREARARINAGGLLGSNSQGTVQSPYIAIERDAWREVRLLAGEFPMSTWARNRLGMLLTAGADAGTGGDEIERDLGPTPRERIRVVGGTDVD